MTLRADARFWTKAFPADSESRSGIELLALATKGKEHESQKSDFLMADFCFSLR